MGTKYPGFREYVGLNGCYRVHPDDVEPTIDVYLRSVPVFEQDGEGELVLPDPVNRSVPDVSFILDNDDGYWSIVSMEVPSFGMDGVNDFLQALMVNQEELGQPDDLLPLIQTLLDERGARWGELPIDLETEFDTHKLTDREDYFYIHPGI